MMILPAHHPASIRAAVSVLKKGGVVVFPTETSYGIGCDATNAKAVRRVFRIKGRPGGKGTPLLVDSRAAAKRWAVFSKEAEGLAKKHWPGALTIVLSPRSKKIAPACLQDGTLSLRLSSHPVARALASGLGRPIVATSANVSGAPACFSVRTFLQQLSGEAGSASGGNHSTTPDLILDAGALPRRRPSTLVRIDDGRVSVLRQGSVRV